MEDAEAFPPLNFAPVKEDTPAYLFKQFLENAPLHGSYTVAFAESWQQLKKQIKDGLPLFELHIRFQLYRSRLAIGLSWSYRIYYKDCQEAIMDDYQLSETEINKLKQPHRKAKTRFEADRLKARFLLGEGWEPKTVAHVLDKDAQTILSYFEHYKDGGIDIDDGRYRIADIFPSCGGAGVVLQMPDQF